MRAFAIKRSDIDRCPIRSLSAEHYNDDGSCLCEPRTPQQILRKVLRDAMDEGIINAFAVRAGGRATVYPAVGGGKYYTTSTLDTLTLLERLRAER